MKKVMLISSMLLCTFTIFASDNVETLCSDARHSIDSLYTPFMICNYTDTPFKTRSATTILQNGHLNNVPKTIVSGTLCFSKNNSKNAYSVLAHEYIVEQDGRTEMGASKNYFSANEVNNLNFRSLAPIVSMFGEESFTTEINFKSLKGSFNIKNYNGGRLEEAYSDITHQISCYLL